MKNFITNGTSSANTNNNRNREISVIFSDAKAIGKNVEKIAVAIRTALKMFDIPVDYSAEGFYVHCVDAVATLMAEISEYDGWNNPMPETINKEHWLHYYEFCGDNEIFSYLCKATAENATFRDSVTFFRLMAANNMLEQFDKRYNVIDVAVGLKNAVTKQKIRQLLNDMYEHFKSEGVKHFGYEPTDFVQIDIEDIHEIIKML